MNTTPRVVARELVTDIPILLVCDGRLPQRRAHGSRVFAGHIVPHPPQRHQGHRAHQWCRHTAGADPTSPRTCAGEKTIGPARGSRPDRGRCSPCGGRGLQDVAASPWVSHPVPRVRTTTLCSPALGVTWVRPVSSPRFARWACRAPASSVSRAGAPDADGSPDRPHRTRSVGGRPRSPGRTGHRPTRRSPAWRGPSG